MKLCWVGAGFFVLGICQAALSQDECGNDPLFAEARRKEALAAEDDKVLDTWLECELSAVELKIGGAEEDKALQNFRDAVTSQFAEATTTAAFRDRMANRAGDRFATELSPSGNPDPKQEIRTLHFSQALHQAKHPGLAAAFQRGLGTKNEGARYHCVAGFAELLPAIVQDPAAAKSALAALEAAGIAETSNVIIGNIYLALSIPTLAKEAGDAMANIFAARWDRVKQGLAIRDRAEAYAYGFLRDQAGQLDNNTRNRIVQFVALFTENDVDQFQSGALNLDEKRTVAERIHSAEQLLIKVVSLTGKAPSISEALKNNTDPYAELTKWIGSADVEGELNKAPYNLPRGGEAEADAAPTDAPPADGKEDGK